MKQRLISIALALVLLLGMLSACASDGSSTDTTAPSATTPQTTQAAETTAEPEIVYPEIEAVDYSADAPFRIWGRNADTGNSFVNRYYDVHAVELTGESMNDVVYKRNKIVEEKYKTKLEVVFTKKPDNSILSGSSDFDIMYPTINNAMKYAAKGLLLDISDYAHLNLDAPWWMTSAIENLTVYGKLYALSCDVNITSYDCIPVMFYNKVMAEEASVPNLYTMVDNNEWTFETFTALCQNLSRDLDGDQALTEKDQYGLAVNNFGYMGFFYGTGETFVEKDAQDAWSLDLTSEKKLNILSDIVKLLNDETINLFGEKYNTLVDNGRAIIPQQTFAENRSLFWVELMSGAGLLRDMEADFGILPMPKYDKAQENYTSILHTSAGVFCVPNTNIAEDKTGRIAEDLARYSHDTVKPAYVEVLIKSRIGRDADSARMIDIIHKNVVVDFGLLMTSVNSDIRTQINENRTDFSSLFASNKESYEKKISDYYNSVAALGQSK